MNLLIVAPLLILDQLTKFFVSRSLGLNESVAIIRGVFHITLVHNRGAAFGILKNQLLLFIATSVVAVGLIFASLKKHASPKVTVEKIALNLILAGALGNLIDRVRYGYVIDFLDLRIWPVFNVADSAITIGATMLVCAIFWETRARRA